MKPWTLSVDLYKNRKCMCGFLQRLHLAYTIKQVLNIEFVHSEIDKLLSKQPMQLATAHANILFDGTLVLIFSDWKKNIYIETRAEPYVDLTQCRLSQNILR